MTSDSTYDSSSDTAELPSSMALTSRESGNAYIAAVCTLHSACTELSLDDWPAVTLISRTSHESPVSVVSSFLPAKGGSSSPSTTVKLNCGCSVTLPATITF